MARMRGGSAARRRVRRALLVGVGVLYVASIPWYRAADATPGVWLGLPDWVAVALLCYVGAAFANAGAWLLAEVSDGEPVEGRGARDAPDPHLPPARPGATGPRPGGGAS